MYNLLDSLKYSIIAIAQHQIKKSLNIQRNYPLIFTLITTKDTLTHTPLYSKKTFFHTILSFLAEKGHFVLLYFHLQILHSQFIFQKNQKNKSDQQQKQTLNKSVFSYVLKSIVGSE
jgi:hypothetical protein